MTDDIFRSMKAQMEPSDDVVADLLAKIALETPAPVTEGENVISFQRAAEKKSVSTKQFTKKSKKSIWYYGTAAAASVIVMFSVFTMMDIGDENHNNAAGLLQSVIGSTSGVVNPANPDAVTENPVSPEDPSGQSLVNPDEVNDKDTDADQNSGKEPSSTDENSGNNNQTPSDAKDPTSGDSKDNQGNQGNSSDKNDNSSKHSGSSENDSPQAYDDPDSAANSENGGNGGNAGNSSGKDSSQVPQDKGKVTPGAAGAADISWTNEIVNSSQVASISVSGSNYVVGSTLSKSDVTSTLDTVTIELPQTSTTNAATVKAKVCKVKNVSSDAVVALEVDGFKEPLVYANADYSPETLGQFVSDLGLSGNITFSKNVRCQISHVGYSSNQSYKTDVSGAVWTWLLNQSDAGRAGKSSFNSGNSKGLFVSASNPTGSQMKFGVSDNGYLWISMLGKDYTFHIGSSNAKGFLESVTGESLG